ncbi:hypothetical protein C2G38_2034808 [Gigaspora rosea]|uniref:Uncharacterized protein n=1 Tax=Gigaspora rosea TaxID=44941 RepID=A0A397VER9_9GLOM|nr:hypothetical protein C2G38_2034808 [Gigaspora rosea]
MAINSSNSIILNNPGLKTVLNEEEPHLSETEQEFETEETEHATVNFNDIQNPTKVKGRGRPPKCRYMSSIEKEQKREGNSTHGSYKCGYKCGMCGKTGHNAAFHKK